MLLECSAPINVCIVLCVLHKLVGSSVRVWMDNIITAV